MRKKYLILIISTISVLVIGAILFFTLRGQNDYDEVLEEVALEWFKGENKYDCDGLDYILNNRRIKDNNYENYQNISHENIYYDDVDFGNLSLKERYQFFEENHFNIGYMSIQREVIYIVKTLDIFYIAKIEDGLEIVIEFSIYYSNGERSDKSHENKLIHLKIHDDSILKMNSKKEYEEFFDDFKLEDIEYIADFYTLNNMYAYGGYKAEELGVKIVERLEKEDKKYKNAELVDVVICSYQSVEYGFGYNDYMKFNSYYSNYGEIYQKYFAELVIKMKDGYELKKIGLVDSMSGEERYYDMFQYYSEFKYLHPDFTNSNYSEYERLFYKYAVSRNLYDAIMSNNQKITVIENNGNYDVYDKSDYNYLVYDNRYKINNNDAMVFALYKKTNSKLKQFRVPVIDNSVLLFAVDELLDIDNLYELVEYNTSYNLLYFGRVSEKVNGKYLYAICIKSTANINNYITFIDFYDIEIYQFDWHYYYADPTIIDYGKNIIENNYNEWFIIDFK